MNLLNHPINIFSYSAVESFCKEGVREGVQIDYKRELPKSGLKKHFAAFSNTRGGLIIIGVEEDKITGIPLKWDGVDNNTKQVEQIHQWATDVDPIPTYDLHVTDEVNGKVYILVRIFEGSKTPYFVQNDSNVWVRTGSVNNPINIASPDELESLFQKRDKASKARNIYFSQATEIYKALLNRAEHERQRLLIQEKDDYQKKNDPTQTSYQPFKSLIYQHKLGTQASICTAWIQPFYPRKAEITPSQLMGKVMEIRDGGRYRLDFPSLNMNAIPNGIENFSWNHNNGQLFCEQLYTTGLMYYSSDILKVDNNGEKSTYSTMIADILFRLLQTAKCFYEVIKYQGELIGEIVFNNAKDVYIHPISTDRGISRDFIYGGKKGLLDVYKWELSINTTVINVPQDLDQWIIKKVIEIEWDLGYSDITDSHARYFLSTYDRLLIKGN